MKLFMFIAAAAIAMLIACDKPGSLQGTKDRAAAEQEAARDVENRNLAGKAEKMEQDLADRHSFYAAIEGQYQGTVTTDDEIYNIRITFVRSIQPFPGGRIRQLSEIEADINNLFFSVQTIQWFGDDMATAIGCRVKEVKPGMDTGVIVISSAECPNVYTVQLSHDGLPFEKSGPTSKELAQKIRSKELNTVDALAGLIQPTSNARTYTFAVKRVKQVIK